ncbi:MAG: hypothetical protein JJU02_08795 [Cryomorphaceae bacterium]|nr:hypothetical protein [Cryomorphaceae bacterium]
MKSINWKFIFNPFNRIAGAEALLLGLVFLIVGATLAGITNARFDGAIDLHFVEDSNFLTALIDQVINAVIITACFYLTAWLSGAKKTRIIDIAGTMLLAKAPYALLPLLNLGGVMYGPGMALAAGDQPDATEMGIMILLSIPLIAFTVWSIALMVNAYKVSANLRGKRMVIGFIIALLVAEIITKIIVQPEYF